MIQVFSVEWFHKYQRPLLFFCNNFILKYWFRWILKINKDLKWSEKIAVLEPNNYKVITNREKREVRADFRTNDKFARRLYYAFYPLWWCFHQWDMIMKPKWNLGFDTLTAYPQAGHGGGNVTCDGFVDREGVTETLSVIRAGAGVYADTDSELARVQLTARSSTDNYSALQRGIETFDTSTITAASVISAAVISLYGYSIDNSVGACDVHIVSVTPAANNDIATADYSQFGSTSFANIVYASLSTAGYNDFTLDANGRANVSKTGVSKFGQRSSLDLNNSATWASFGASYFYWQCADSSGTSTDPKLVVTYSIPATGNFFMFM